MAVSYKRLWKLLIDKDMKKTDLITLAGINVIFWQKWAKGRWFRWIASKRYIQFWGVMLGIL